VCFHIHTCRYCDTLYSVHLKMARVGRNMQWNLIVYKEYLVAIEVKYLCFSVLLYLQFWTLVKVQEPSNSVLYTTVRTLKILQFCDCFITFTIFPFKDVSFFSMSNVVSSVNKTTIASWTAWGKSFINNKNKMGPKTEPWGTPYFISLREERSIGKIYELIMNVFFLWVYTAPVLQAIVYDLLHQRP
jgi:hypothetical protein